VINGGSIMGLLNERVANLKAAAEEIKFDENSSESKLLKMVIDVVDEMATEVDNLQQLVDTLSEQVDDIDEDLAHLENAMDENSDEYLQEIQCPNCETVIMVPESDLVGDEHTVKCESCGEEIIIEIAEADGCGCGCGDSCDEDGCC
jgi:predicted Zn finger-like uncharacterized protein